jgi:hypothetical protein
LHILLHAAAPGDVREPRSLARQLLFEPPRRLVMYYGIGGTILIVLLVLFLLGRI